MGQHRRGGGGILEWEAWAVGFKRWEVGGADTHSLAGSEDIGRGGCEKGPKDAEGRLVGIGEAGTQEVVGDTQMVEKRVVVGVVEGAGGWRWRWRWRWTGGALGEVRWGGTRGGHAGGGGGEAGRDDCSARLGSSRRVASRRTGWSWAAHGRLEREASVQGAGVVVGGEEPAARQQHRAQRRVAERSRAGRRARPPCSDSERLGQYWPLPSCAHVRAAAPPPGRMSVIML